MRVNKHGMVRQRGLDFGIDERDLHKLIDKMELPEVIIEMSKVRHQVAVTADCGFASPVCHCAPHVI